jgi:hypothetical protein
MRKLVRMFGLAAILTTTGLETATAAFSGVCAGFTVPSGRRCQTTTTTKQECCDQEAQCPYNGEILAGAQWTPYGGMPQSCFIQ